MYLQTKFSFLFYFTVIFTLATVKKFKMIISPFLIVRTYTQNETAAKQNNRSGSTKQLNSIKEIIIIVQDHTYSYTELLFIC